VRELVGSGTRVLKTIVCELSAVVEFDRCKRAVDEEHTMQACAPNVCLSCVENVGVLGRAAQSDNDSAAGAVERTCVARFPVATCRAFTR
jgi:hypothetical protein